ncbi:MAG: hypothetical protein S4CHLAM81_06540 [Chlamydiales bacterium]|nr:hypothetical protein [Chlamydiales bacterium]MCH9635438.1 hypothetical protein [Chlamydiales bacterium]MCH9703627.1 glycine--tRNA ligase subunit beta [Chlamydiota bacterium]
MNFQEMITTLERYWAEQGCLIQQGYDLEVGAGTLNPSTFLRALGPEPYATVYVEPSRRPKDGRYGQNPNRVQFYHQMQVIIKPSPLNLQELYLGSLKAIGLDISKHDIRFVHDDWENPTIGAWGLGWEVWADGMEVTQYTYFQAVGGLPVDIVTGELTYGLERLALYLQGKDSIFDLQWDDNTLYGEIFKRNELEWSSYNFDHSNSEMWRRHFDDFESEAKEVAAKGFPIPAYDFVMKASHAFNMLDARGCISVSERAFYIGRVRALAKLAADSYVQSRTEQGHPLLKSKIEWEPPTATAPKDVDGPADFLLEVGVEELPASFVSIGMDNLKSALSKLLKEHEITHNSIECYGTPRRLALIVKNLAGGTPSKKVEKRGPSAAAAFTDSGELAPAGLGFFRSLGLEPVTRDALPSSIEIRNLKGQDYLFASYESAGISTARLLSEKLGDLILGLDFPKKMRWSHFDFAFARPLRWIVSLFGKEVIPFVCGNIVADRKSYGHRQLHPKEISISKADGYVATLKKAKVMVDPLERKKAIADEIFHLKKQPAEGERVMRQVVHLVEWPFVLMGNFDSSYLRAPKEVLISEMVEHQKYFPLLDESGNLEPHFIVVSNNTPSDLIRHGHECALSPRLADGVFLFEEDQKKPLEEFAKKLSAITFQRDLGTLADKVVRLKQIAKKLHSLLPLCPLDQVEKAAELCKADLATELVGEFPDLQGVVGRLYASAQGVQSEVALAIDEHWMPRGEKRPLPKSACGTLLSLCEKIDNLISFFSIGLKPTSSSDPFALRRQALGLIKIVLDQQLSLPLKEFFSEEILQFLTNRLRHHLVDEGFGKEPVDAVLSQSLEDICKSYRVLKDLEAFRSRKEFAVLLEIYTRVFKILEKSEAGEVDPALFEEASERALFEVCQKLVTFDDLVQLQQPVARFFDEVKVMADDERVRANRLALLAKVRSLFDNLADFSKLR